jgi:GT2 family glycosyltransferase
VQVIVVDNASTDGAADMVAREFPEVVLVRNPVNRGFARACNQAAARSTGRFLFFLNNDTIVPPGALRRLLDFAESHPRAGMIGPRLRDPVGRTQVSCRPRPTLAMLLHRTWILRWTRLLKRRHEHYRRGPAGQTSGPRRVDALMGAAVLLPRRVFFTSGGWDEDYTFGGEDFDLSTRVGRRLDVIYLPDVTITHHGRASTRINVEYSAPHVAIGLARYLRKSGRSPWAIFFYKLMISLDAPLLLASRLWQYAWRRMTGRWHKAQQSWQRIKESWYFLTRGLIDFWKV